MSDTPRVDSLFSVKNQGRRISHSLRVNQALGLARELERENADLRAKLEAADSVIQEQEIVIGLIAKALKVGDEPHQGYHARLLEAAEAAQRDVVRVDYLDANSKIIVRSGKQHIRPLIDAAMQEGK